jgi:hypothetical protein
MPRARRDEVFPPDENCFAHLYNRCVQGAYLCGVDHDPRVARLLGVCRMGCRATDGCRYFSLNRLELAPCDPMFRLARNFAAIAIGVHIEPC